MRYFAWHELVYQRLIASGATNWDRTPYDDYELRPLVANVTSCPSCGLLLSCSLALPPCGQLGGVQAKNQSRTVEQEISGEVKQGH